MAGLARREALGAFDEEVARLPAADRAAVVLRHLHGLSRTEAAGRLGVSGATAKDRPARRGFALPLPAPAVPITAVTAADPVPAAAAVQVCRPVDPPSLSGAHAPRSSSLPDRSEKGLSAMNFLPHSLKSRRPAALLTAAAGRTRRRDRAERGVGMPHRVRPGPARPGTARPGWGWMTAG